MSTTLDMPTISQSRAAMLYECQAKHDFGYEGVLTGLGHGLVARKVAPPLTRGSVWGKAVSAYHLYGLPVALNVVNDAYNAIIEDAATLLESEVDDLNADRDKMVAVMKHYAEAAPRMTVASTEQECIVPVAGAQYVAYFDLTVVEGGQVFIVENKLRMSALYPIEQVYGMRQLRWYAWAFFKATGNMPAGVIYDERLFAAPEEPRVLKNGRISKDKSQNTSAYLYAKACQEAGHEPDPDAVEAFAAKQWQQRTTLFLTSQEIEDAGKEIQSTANLVAFLRDGTLWPVRNKGRHCSRCQFKDICDDPNDIDTINALYRKKGVAP